MTEVKEKKKFEKLYSFVENLASDPQVTPFHGDDENLEFTFDEDIDDVIYAATNSSKEFGALEEYLGLGNGGWWLHTDKLGLPYDPEFSDDLYPTREQSRRICEWLREPFNTEPILSEKKSFMERINIMAGQETLPFTPVPLTPVPSTPKGVPNTPNSAGFGNIIQPKQIFSDVMPKRSNVPMRGAGTYDISNESKINSRILDGSSNDPQKSYTLNRAPQANMFRRDTFEMSRTRLMVPSRSSHLQSDSLSNSFAKEVISEEEENFNPLLTPKPSQNPQPSRNTLSVPKMAKTFSNEALDQLKASGSLNKSYELNMMRSSNDSIREVAKLQEAALKSSVGSKYRSPSESKNNSRENLCSSNPDFTKALDKIGPARHQTNVSYDRLPNMKDSSNSIFSKANEQIESLKSQMTFKRSTSKTNDFQLPIKNYYNPMESNQEFNRSDSLDGNKTIDLEASCQNSQGNAFFGSSYNENDLNPMQKLLKSSPYSSIEAVRKQQEELEGHFKNFRRSKAGQAERTNESSIENLRESRDSSLEEKNLRRSYDLIPKLSNPNSLNGSTNDVNASYDIPRMSDGIAMRHPKRNPLDFSTETFELNASFTRQIGENLGPTVLAPNMVTHKPPIPKQHNNSGPVTGYRAPTSRIPQPSRIPSVKKQIRPPSKK